MQHTHIKEAPAVLKREHARFADMAKNAPEGSQCAHTARILGALTQHLNMAHVWPKLAKQSHARQVNLDSLPAHEGAAHSRWEWGFAVEVICADQPLKAWEDTAPASRKKALSRIVKQARALAIEMQSFRDYEYFYALSMVAPHGTERGTKLQALTGHEPFLLSFYARHDHAVDVSVSDVLLKIAEDCEQVARIPPIVHAAKADSSTVLALVRRLHVVMKERFGTPMHDCVAKIATSIYPDAQIDAEKVRLICSTAPGKKERKTGKLNTGNNKP